MSIVSYYHKNPDILVEVWLGDIAPDEITQYFEKKFGDPGNRSPRLQLVDLRFGSPSSSLTHSLLVDAVFALQQYRQIYTRHQIGVIAGARFRQLGFIIRLLHSISRPITVFNHIDTACQWLDVEPQEIELILRSTHQSHMKTMRLKDQRVRQIPSCDLFEAKVIA